MFGLWAASEVGTNVLGAGAGAKTGAGAGTKTGTGAGAKTGTGASAADFPVLPVDVLGTGVGVESDDEGTFVMDFPG